MQTVRSTGIKTCSEPIYSTYIGVSLLGRSVINSLPAPSSTTLISLACFSLFNSKKHYSLFEFLNDTLVHIQPHILNIGTFEMLKTEVVKFLNQRFQKP